MIIKTPWTQQPQVATEIDARWNPAAAWNFATKRDAVSGLGMVFGADNSSGVWQDGRYVRVTGASNLNRVECVSSVSAIAPGAGDFTVTVTFVFDGQAPGYSAFGRWNTGGTPSTSDWFLGAGSTFATATADFTVACGSTFYNASASGAWVVGNKYTFIGRRRGTTIYVDRYNHTTGVWVSGSTTNAGITVINYNAARKTVLGEIAIDIGYNIAATYSTAATFPRFLSGAEVRSLTDNPWQIFKPIPRRIFVPVSATGDATGTGSLYAITLSSPTGSATGTGVANGTGTGSFATSSLTSPEASATGSALATASIQGISLTAPLGSASAGTSATATGSIVSAALSAPSATATGSALATGALIAVTLTTIPGSAVGSALATGAIDQIDLSTVSGSAFGTTAGNATGIGAVATIALSAPTATALGAALATGTFVPVSLSTVTGSASNATNATATGGIQAISISAPLAIAIASSVATGGIQSIGMTAPLGSASGYNPLTDSAKIDLILDILSNKQTLDPVSGLYTLYADDGTTVLKTALAFEDAAGLIPYRGQGLQRLDPME